MMRQDPIRVRATVAAFTHQEALTLAVAADMSAEGMDKLDALHPDPAMRESAATLRRLSIQLRKANAARNFIEGDE